MINENFCDEISDLLGYIYLESFPEEKIIRLENINILPTKKVLSEKFNKLFINILLVSTFMSFSSPRVVSASSQMMFKEKGNSFRNDTRRNRTSKTIVEVNIFYSNSTQKDISKKKFSILNELFLRALQEQNDLFKEYLPEKNVFPNYSKQKAPFLILKGNGDVPNFINQKPLYFEPFESSKLKEKESEFKDEMTRPNIKLWIIIYIKFYLKFLFGSLFLYFLIIILKRLFWLFFGKYPLPLDGDYLSFEDIELLKPKDDEALYEELKKPNSLIRMREIIEYTFDLLKELQKDIVCSEKPVRILIYGKNGELVDGIQTYFTFLLEKLDQYLNPKFFETLQDLIVKIDSREDYLFNFSNKEVLTFMIKFFCESIDYEDFECVIQLINQKR